MLTLVDTKLGIGTEEPNQTLDFNGAIQVGSSSTESMSADDGGTLRCYQTTGNFEGWNRMVNS